MTREEIMDQEEILNELLELILSVDQTETDVQKLHEDMHPHLRAIAEWLFIAKTDVRIEVSPNVYDIYGRTDTFGKTYFDDAGDTPLVLTYPTRDYIKGVAALYPRRGHEWTPEELRRIEAVSKLMVGFFSGASMLRRELKTPYTDLLTGLANNPGVAYYGARIEEKHAMSEYTGCFINLKNFKYINEKLGNPGGDRVMRQYAFRLNDSLDPSCELLARLGGDNFFALVRNEHAEKFLGTAVSLNITLGSGDERQYVPLGAWIGVYHAEEDDSVTQVLINASFAYEQAKKSRVTVSYYDPSHRSRSLHARAVAQAFPEALRSGELVCCYQPKVYLSTGELYGCEALVRWVRDGKMIPPSDFVPIAESHGLVGELDRHMLECVCRDLRTWLDRGIEPVRVSVNYSQHDFYNENLVEETLKIIRRYRVEGKYLEIEITESSFFENFQALEDFIKAMHRHGIEVSLDDFGTGYSSLNMLKSLDLDTVKLDKSFFDNLSGDSENDRVVLRSVADMLSQLHKTAISEGVETPEQYKFAREIGCDIIQGYFFDKPLSFEEFTERLINRRYNTVPMAK